MSRIPYVPLILSLAGLIPFIWGAATSLSAPLQTWGAGILGARLVGPYIQFFYGSVILSFMSGVLWGFAAKAKGSKAGVGYALSTIPALWALFMTGGGPVSAASNLALGFLGLLILDFIFDRWGLTPQWWIPLRMLVTAVVVVCLGVVVFA